MAAQAPFVKSWNTSQVFEWDGPQYSDRLRKKVTDCIEFSIPSIAEVFGPSESSDVTVLE